MEIKFSYFAPTHNNDKSKYYPGNIYLGDLTTDEIGLELIKIKEYKDKTELNAITPSLFNYKSRAETPKNENYNGVIHLDFDKINDKAALNHLLCQLNDDPYTLFSFISPSSNGIKVFVQTDNKNIDDHLDSWNEVRKYYYEEYGIEADKACKDIKRLCFIPTDFDYYQAIEPDIFEISKKTNIQVSNDDEILNYIVNKLNTRYKKDFVDGEKHDFSCHFAAEANRAGISKENAINYFFQKFNEFSNDFDHHSDNITNYYDKYPEQFGTVQFGNIRKKIRLVSSDDKYIILRENFIDLIRIGYDLDQFAFEVNKSFEENNLSINLEIIKEFYEDHRWLFETAEMNDKGRIKDVVSNHVKIARLTRFNLFPRYDEIRQKHQIIENGEYLDYSNKLSNTITGRLEEFYNIRLSSLDKFIYNHDNTIDYNPIREYLQICKQEKQSDRLFEIFCEHNRFHFENEEDKELFKYQVTRFCVLAVAQWLNIRVCDVSLVAVSEKQGTGKTTFFEFLFKWFGENKLRGQADYDITRIDVIRKWCGTANLHDDEIFYRNKRDNRLYKSVLSEQQFTFTEKYQTEMRTEYKVAVLTQCTNDMSFLKESSRRDYVLRFAENTNYDAKKMREQLDDPEVFNGWWAMILNEFETNYNYYDQVPEKFIKVIEDKMKDHVEITTEDEFVLNFFEPADETHVFDNFNKSLKFDSQTYRSLKHDVNYVVNTNEMQNFFKDHSGHTTTKQRLKNSFEKHKFVYKAKNINNTVKRGWLVKKAHNIDDDININKITDNVPF